MSRSILASLLVATVVSTSIGFAFGKASEPAPASARSAVHDSASLRPLNNHLRSIDRYTKIVAEEIFKLQLTLGSSPIGGMRADVTDLKRELSTTIEGYLREICRNTEPAAPGNCLVF